MKQILRTLSAAIFNGIVRSIICKSFLLGIVLSILIACGHSRTYDAISDDVLSKEEKSIVSRVEGSYLGSSPAVERGSNMNPPIEPRFAYAYLLNNVNSNVTPEKMEKQEFSYKYSKEEFNQDDFAEMIKSNIPICELTYLMSNPYGEEWSWHTETLFFPEATTKPDGTIGLGSGYPVEGRIPGFLYLPIPENRLFTGRPEDYISYDESNCDLFKAWHNPNENDGFKSICDILSYMKSLGLTNKGI